MPPSTDQEFERREFTCTNGGSNKFWNISKRNGQLFDNPTWSGNRYFLITNWGPIGSRGTSKEKNFYTWQTRDSEYNRLITSKLGKGYVEVTNNNGQPIITQPAPPIPSIEQTEEVIPPPKKTRTPREKPPVVVSKNLNKRIQRIKEETPIAPNLSRRISRITKGNS